MHFRTSSTFALLAAALTLGAAAEASAQVIPRGGKQPAPCVCDTVRITRVDTVTVFRTDTVRTTIRDTVRIEPLPLPVVPLAAGGPYFGLGGGLTFPTGDFGNYNMGWNATAMFGFDFRGNPFGWRIDGSYDQFAERSNTAAAAADPTLFTVNGDLKFRIPFGESRRSHLYAIGGVTYGRYKDILVGPRTDANVTTTAEANAAGLSTESIDNYTDEWGWNAGGGINFAFGNASNLFIESRLINLEGSFVPLIVGLRWGR
jgi:hypothetical protein